MKKIIFLCIVSLAVFCFSWKVVATGNPRAAITTVKQNGTTIEFSIASAGKFRIGNNVQVLHVGAKNFSLSKQHDDPGKSILTFLIPLSDFNSLVENDDVWLSYGNKFNGEIPTKKEIETLC